MAFPSRRKNKTNESGDEYSTQLISKPAKNNTTSHYATFDENNEVNNMQPRFKISNLRIRNHDKVISPGNNFLSPNTTSSYQRLTYSQPVTPTKPMNHDNSQDLDAMVSTTLSTTLKLQRSVSSKILAVKPPPNTIKIAPRPKTNTKKARPKSVQNPPTSKSHSFIEKSQLDNTNSGNDNYKKITPQLWDDVSSDSFQNTHKQRSNSNNSLISYGKYIKKNKVFPSTPGTLPTLSTPIGSKTVGFPRVKTSREHNKKFIMERIQNQNTEASLFRRRSVVSNYTKTSKTSMDYDQKFSLASHMSYSINNDEAAQYESYEMVTQKPMDYNQYNYLKKKSDRDRSTVSTKIGPNLRQQLVYIGGINDINKYDVRDRLYDLFEIWGDRPDICPSDLELWNTDCIYVRFPSIAQSIDGINVFDGLQPNGYVLCAELVLEGSQMVYIDGLDGDWNEEIFKNFVDINNDYKVSIKCNKGDKAYAFVQFSSLEAVQSAIDRFDGETEIDGKLVRWEHMVKAYIGKIGQHTTTNDIQNELSEFDPSFKYLPVEIRKSREPIYYDHHRLSSADTTINNEKKINRDDDTSHNINIKQSKNNTRSTVPITPSLSTIESSRLILADRASHSNLFVDNLALDINANQLKPQWTDSLENQITPINNNNELILKRSSIPMLDETKMVSNEDLLMNTNQMLEETKFQHDNGIYKFGKNKKEHVRYGSSTLSSVNTTPIPSDSNSDHDMDMNMDQNNQISNLRVQITNSDSNSNSNSDSDCDSDSDITELTEDTIEFEWHY
eukprot:379644_1